MAAPHEYEPEFGRPRRSRAGCVGWVLVVLLLAIAAALVKFVYLPLRSGEKQLRAKTQEFEGREKKLKKQLSEAEARHAELRASQEQLSGRLAQTEAEREKLESELKRVQSELSAKLEPEIQAGNVRIKRRGNELVVDVSDQILFDSGHANVNSGGQKVLGQVAQSLAQLKSYVIQVGGHTDNARVVNPETKELFPTNWELSTTRATNVVRFLEERGRIPGTRLMAAGFAEFRPAASNATPEDRQKNRRIEITLLPATPN